MRTVVLLLCTMITVSLTSQTNMHFTTSALTAVVHGTYDPADYAGGQSALAPQQRVVQIQDMVSADSLKSYLLALEKFETRNSGSDTLSDVRGIGASRNWIQSKFADIDQKNGGRLETGFFEFDQDICGMSRHKNVVAALPGTDPGAPLIIVEAHMDSRCNVNCDVDCLALGMEDNGSGTALVIELARVMSTFSFNNTILFITTTAEEQGLLGANAVAQYIEDNAIGLKMVQNNDVIGGIICGATSSPPSCPSENLIDSTQVRMFSRGGFNSKHKSLCRFIKLQYQEMLEPIAHVPMLLTIMTDEDRAGRGGDHIPFGERGLTAMRFTSSHEHGDASNGPDYHDRQHTSQDVLGVDLDNDGELDSFFVDFNYLARNTVINATSLAMAAIGPKTPEIDIHFFDGDTFFVRIASEIAYPQYVIGLRTGGHDFDTLYYLTGTNQGEFVTAEREFAIALSVAAIDSNGVESLFSGEVLSMLSSTSDPSGFREKPIRLMNNRPNPFDESTTLSFWVESPISYHTAFIRISDLNGRELARMETGVVPGMNEVIYYHGYGATATLVQTLVIDGAVIDSKRMVFAN